MNVGTTKEKHSLTISDSKAIIISAMKVPEWESKKRMVAAEVLLVLVTICN